LPTAIVECVRNLVLWINHVLNFSILTVKPNEV
jgi:hypothetical protein